MTEAVKVTDADAAIAERLAAMGEAALLDHLRLLSRSVADAQADLEARLRERRLVFAALRDLDPPTPIGRIGEACDPPMTATAVSVVLNRHRRGQR